jgi:hypothetical protein
MRSWFFGSFLVAVGLLRLPDAVACATLAPPPALEGFPKEGSTAVPTNVIPIFDGERARVSSPFTGAVFELASASGEIIALAPRQSHVWHFELLPASPLLPRTQYTLRGRWRSDRYLTTPVELSLSFTTGDGPLQEAATAPVAFMQHYTLTTAVLSSCDVPPNGTCVAHPTDTFVEHFYLDDLVNDPSIYEGGFGVQGPYLYGQSAWTNLSGIDQGTPYQCVRLRTRAYDGTYSEPVVLCGKDAPHYVVEGSAMLECTPQGLAHDGQLLTGAPSDRPAGAGGADAGTTAKLAGRQNVGCSMTRMRSGDGALPGLCLAGALALASRRLRRRSRGRDESP